jgi:hypothetical protein
MKFRLSPTWRRVSGVLAIAAVALIAVSVSQGGSGPGKVVAPLYFRHDSCAVLADTKIVGKATFTKKGGILTLRVSFHGGEPGQYRLYLYQSFGPGTCGTSWNLGKFKVDSSGDGSKVGSVDVSGYGNTFFAAPYNEDIGEWYESNVVKV